MIHRVLILAALLEKTSRGQESEICTQQPRQHQMIDPQMAMRTHPLTENVRYCQVRPRLVVLPFLVAGRQYLDRSSSFW